MENTLQQIKDEYATGDNFHNWDALFDSCAMYDYERLESAINQIAIRYAQEQKRELVEMLESVVQLQKDHYGNRSRTHIALILKAKEIEKLIKSATEG